MDNTQISAEEIRNKLASLKGSKRLPIEALRGIEDLERKIENASNIYLPMSYSGGGGSGSGGSGGGSNITTTVGPSGANYTTDGVADDVQINQAIAAVNTAGGGIVDLKPGTYWITDSIQLKSNVHMRGSGIGLTIIKSVTGFTPANTNPEGGYSMLISFGNTTITSCSVRHITWDANSQNQTPADMSNARHRAIYLKLPTDFYFQFNEVKNPIHYAFEILSATRAWITNNWIYAGAQSYDDYPYTTGLDQQDGIHIQQSNYVWITDNYVDTWGTATAGARSSGDDAIAIGQYNGYDATASRYIYCERNTILSGSRGILLTTDSANIEYVLIKDNIIVKAFETGIYMHTAGAIKTGQQNHITIEGNKVIAAAVGTVNNNQSGGIAIYSEGMGQTNFFNDVKILNNDVLSVAYLGTLGILSGQGIVVFAAGTDLEVSGNTVSGIAGGRTISIGVGSTQVTGVIVTNNNVVASVAGTHGIALDACLYGTVSNNRVKGSTTGTGIRILGRTGFTVGYITVIGNFVDSFTSGITEETNTVVPNYDIFVGNLTKSCTNEITMVGAQSTKTATNLND